MPCPRQEPDKSKGFDFLRFQQPEVNVSIIAIAIRYIVMYIEPCFHRATSLYYVLDILRFGQVLKTYPRYMAVKIPRMSSGIYTGIV